MFKWMFWTSLALGIVALFGLCALVMVPMALESPRLRPQLQGALSKALGRPVLLDGPVHLRFWPSPRLEASEVRMLGHGQAQGAESVKIGSVEAEASFSHLLTHGLSFQSLRVQDLSVSLSIGKSGELDWGAPAPRTPKHTPGSRAPKAWSPLPEALLGTQIHISRGSVLLWDQASGKHMEIRGVEMQLGSPSAGGAQSLSLKGQLRGQDLLVEGSLTPLGGPHEGPGVSVDVSFQAGTHLKGSAWGEIKAAGSSPWADLWIRLEPFSIARLSRALDVEIPPRVSGGFDRVSFQGIIKASKDAIELHQGRVELEHVISNVSATFRTGSERALLFRLETEELDLDRFIPRSGKTGSPEMVTKTPSRQAFGNAPENSPKRSFRLEVPSGRGEVRIHRARLRGEWIEELEADLILNGELVELTSVRLKVAGGEIWGTAAVDLTESPFKVQLDLQSKAVQLGALLELLGGSRFMEGAMGSHWRLQGPWGTNLDEASRTWLGQADVVLEDGSLNGVDLVRVARTLGLSGRGTRRDRFAAKTPFSRLTAHLNISDGIVKVSKASMQGKDLRIKAAGQANLVKRSLDFRLEPEVDLGREQEGKQAVLVVPFWVEGDFSRPRFRADLGAMSKKGEGKLNLTLPSSRELRRALRDLFKGR